MIDRIGYLVANKIVDSKDVNIVLFEKDNGETQVIESGYDEDGFLLKWPIGFFLPRGYKNDIRY
jgi:hypothetical protein